MQRFLRLASPALLAALLVSCAGLGTRTSSLRSQKLLSLGYQPLELTKSSGDTRYSGRFQVNGEPVVFLIDSGANSTDLDASVAQRIGVRADHTVKVISRGALGRPVTSRVGLGTLRAGSMRPIPFPFMLAPSSRGHTATSRYDGQIGLDALSGLAAVVDFQQGCLWIPGPRAPNNLNGNISPLGPRPGLGFDALPLDPAGPLPHLVVESYHNGHRLSWVVDTGAEVTVLAAESVPRLGLQTSPSRSKIIDASGDRAPIRVASLEHVVFGRLIVNPLEVAVTSLAAIRRTFRDRHGHPVDGIIGMDFLERSSALLDTASRVLYVGEPFHR